MAGEDGKMEKGRGKIRKKEKDKTEERIIFPNKKIITNRLSSDVILILFWHIFAIIKRNLLLANVNAICIAKTNCKLYER